MADKARDGKSKRRVSNPDLENTLNFYSDEMTKEVVGRLFEEYAEDDGKNYFKNRPKMDDVLYNAEENDDEEEESENDAADKEVYKTLKLYTPRRVRSKRTDSNKKRNKSKKKLREEMEYEDDIEQEEDNYQENIDDNDVDCAVEEEAAEDIEVAEQESASTKEPKRRAAFLPKLSELGKTYKEDVEEYVPQDEDEDEEADEDIDELYEDDEDEDEDDYQVVTITRDKIIISVLVVILIVVSVALAIRGNRYKNQLAAAMQQIEEVTNANTSSTYETELAELKAKVESLTAENEQLKANGANGAGDAVLSNVEADVEASSAAANAGQESTQTYVVKEGDTFWKISASVYGNGAEYQKILDANGMTEDANLKIGQELKIPN